MPLPPLYAEGLRQHARQGFLNLSVYKLNLIEAILRDTLRTIDAAGPDAAKAKIRQAVEVAQWELPPPWRRQD